MPRAREDPRRQAPPSRGRSPCAGAPRGPLGRPGACACALAPGAQAPPTPERRRRRRLCPPLPTFCFLNQPGGGGGPLRRRRCTQNPVSYDYSVSASFALTATFGNPFVVPSPPIMLLPCRCCPLPEIPFPLLVPARSRLLLFSRAGRGRRRLADLCPHLGRCPSDVYCCQRLHRALSCHNREQPLTPGLRHLRAFASAEPRFTPAFMPSFVPIVEVSC